MHQSDQNENEKKPASPDCGKILKYQAACIGVYVFGALVLALLSSMNASMLPAAMRIAVTLILVGSLSIRLYVFFNWEKILTREQLQTRGAHIFFFTIAVETLAGLLIWML